MMTFKSNRAMYILLVLAFVLVILGQNSVSATHVNQTDELANVNIEEYDMPDSVGSITEKSIYKNVKENEKNSPELADLSLSMEDVEVTYGEVANLDVVTSPEVDEGIMTWYVNERIVGAKNLTNSEASLAFSTFNYKPGNYTVEVTYTGSLLHSSNLTTGTLRINKLESYVTNIVTEFNDENSIDVRLNVEAGPDIIPYGQLNVYQGSNLVKSVEIEEEDVYFTLDKGFNQEILTLEYVGDDYYTTSRTNYFVNIPRYRMNIYLPYLNGFYGSELPSSVTFYSDRLVNDGLLDVYVDGVLVDEYDVESDSVDLIFDLGDYAAGSYDVYLEYFGSDVYEDMDYSTVLTVRQINTTLYSYNVTGHKNESVSLRASVYNFVDDTDEGMVEFVLDNESIKTAWINNITVNENYIIPDSISYGEHELKVIYHGSEKYAYDEGTYTLNVIKYANSLAIRNYTLDNEGNIEINVREYSYNQTVNDGELEYYVNDVYVGVVPVKGNITRIVLPEEYAGDNEYNITLKYVNSDRFEDAILNTAINPTKYDTSTRLYTYTNTNNILNITSYVYSTNYDEINEGIIEFYINDTLIGSQSVINNSANIIYDMNPHEDKTYNIKAKYTGTKKYRTSENNTNINYNRNKKTIYIQTANTINNKPTNTIQIQANITDYETNTIPLTTQAQITIFNQTYTTTIEEGTINFPYTIPANTPDGTYNITIHIPETQNYKETNRTIRLNIYKDNPYITGSNTIRTTMGEKIQINATLNLNREILNENITGLLKINNKTIYQGIFKNGQFTYNLTLNNKYTDNTYNITIISIETNKYHRAEKNIILELSPRNTYITSKNIESKNGEQIIINATVYDAKTRTPVKGEAKVCIKINNVTLENINITNGQILYAYTNDYSAKDYNITIIYGKTSIYNNCTWHGKLTINRDQLRISAHNIQTTAYNTITIRANILSENKLATGPINTAIKINNKTIHEETVTNGKLTYTYTLPDEIGSGKYNLTIIAGDTRKYGGNTTTVDLTVHKNYKEIHTNKITTTTRGTINIKAQIVDINNNPVTKDTKINIKLAGHTISNQNISDGNIEFNYTLPDAFKPGVYDLLIQAGASSGYYHASTNTIVKVE